MARLHNEHDEVERVARVLQLWIGLPAKDRLAAPAIQVLRAGEHPVRRGPGFATRLYSGQSGALRSTRKNLMPITLAAITLEPNAGFDFELPADHGGFFYVVSA